MKSSFGDEIAGKGYDSRLMRRLLKYIKPHKKLIAFAILLNILFALLSSVRPYLTKVAIDDYISTSNYKGLITITIILFATLILQAVIQYVITYSTQYMGQSIIYKIRTEVFRHIQKLSLKYFDKTPVGKNVTRVTNDVEALNQMFSAGIVNIFSDVFIIVSIIVFMFYMSWNLSLITLSVLPILIYATFLFRKKAREAYRKVRKQVSRLNSFMQEHISGMHIVKLFNREKKEQKKFSEINKAYRQANIESIFYYAIFYPTVEFLSSIAVALIIWYGGGKVIDGVMTIGVLFAFVQYTEMFFRPIRDLSEKYNVLQTAMAASERIFSVLDNQTILHENKKPIDLENVKGKIEFENVSFAYNDKDFVLKNISFKICPGETVAIVGATGAGKTSIINLLNRFYDIQDGKILIDNIDITKLPKKKLRKSIATVLQDVYLFSGTIKSNISLGDESISDFKVREVIKIVGLDKFIENLNDGIDTQVREKGATLSLGQKQLISFARALAFNPDILILDEATSNVDTDTEILIQKAIEKLLENRTSIVIAHRLSTVKKANKIIVLHKGEIKEIGNHNELLKNRGIYYRLYQLQYKEQEINIQD